MDLMLMVLSAALSSFSANSSRVVSTEASLRSLERVVPDFRKACGRLPTEEEGLEVLVRKPADWPDAVPWAPLIAVNEVPRDRWGNRFVYILTPGS